MKLCVLAVSVALACPAGAVELTAAVRAAMGADPALASAVANRDAAQENIAIARSRLLPQVALQGTFQQMNQTRTQNGVQSDFSGPSRNAQLTVRQSIYRPRDFAGMDIGRLQAEYGASKLESAKSDLWNRTSSAWIDVLVAQALREVYAAAASSAELAATQERRRFEAGDSTRDAVAEATGQLALARSQLAEARYDLQARLHAFNLLTRLGVQEFAGVRLPATDRPFPLAESREAFLSRVLESNPELGAARIAEAVSERRLAQASADHRPTVDLVASMNHGQNDSVNLLGTTYRSTQVGVQLAVPIFQGGGLNAAQRQASAAFTAAGEDRKSLENRLSAQATADWNSQEGLRERAEGASSLVAAAREQRRAIELGIKGGLRTWADLSVAELQLARREADRIRAVGELFKTQSRLLSLLPIDDPAWDRWLAGVVERTRS